MCSSRRRSTSHVDHGLPRLLIQASFRTPTMTLWLILFISMQSESERILPDIAQIFVTQDTDGFRRLCDPDARVEVDLRPMQRDSGLLSRDQTSLSFRRMNRLYETHGATVTEQKIDTNFARLEMHVLVDLKQRERGYRRQAHMVLQFKLRADGVVMMRWHLQKIH